MAPVSEKMDRKKPLTPAEKMRRYRLKLKSDPVRKEEALAKDRERKKGKYKPVAQMTEREHRNAKKHWRNQKKKDKASNSSLSRQKVQSILKITSERNNLKLQVDRLQKELQNEQRKAQRYRKRAERTTPVQKQPTTPRSKTKKLLSYFHRGSASQKASTTSRVSRTLQYHFTLTSELNGLGGKDKKALAKLKRSYLLRKYKFLHKFRNDFRIGNTPQYSKKGTVCSREKNLVMEFFLRNDISKILPGKKNTVTRKGIKKQKRHLTDTLFNLYPKFKAENPKTNIKFISFYSCKPFWVVRPKDSERQTCMCKICSNMKYLSTSMYSIKAVETSSLSILLRNFTCSVDEQKCMYGECKSCNLKDVADREERTVCDEYTWLAWELVKEERKFKTGEMKSVKVVKKVAKHGTYEELKSAFTTSMQTYKKHFFHMTKQFNHYGATKANLQENEIMIHIDFAENYVGKCASEIQSVHFGASKPQVSLHTGFYVAKEMTEVQSFCGVSDSLCHEPASIWAYLTPVLKHIRTAMPHIKHIHFFSDGPSTQYKQKKNFYLMSTEIFNHGFDSACWNFSAAGHGKGIPDGVGAAVKRACDQLVKFGKDVLSANTIVEEVSKTNTNVWLYEIKQNDIDLFQNLLSKLKLKAVQRTSETHQLVTKAQGEILYRNTSCYCGGSSSIKSDDAFLSHTFNQQKQTRCKSTSDLVELPLPQTNPQPCVNASALLHKLEECQSFADLKHECEAQSLYLYELYGAERACRVTGLACELLYSKFIPKDFQTMVGKRFFPVRVRADGNCLPACGAVFATGKDENPDLIRLKIVHELAIHEDYYLTESNLTKGYAYPTSPNELINAFAMYSDEYMFDKKLDELTVKKIFRKEVMSITNSKSYMGIWQIFGMASVLKMSIQSVYPELGNLFVRKHLNRRVEPRVKVSSGMAAIMWTSTRLSLNALNWVPNHFMPLLPFS